MAESKGMRKDGQAGKSQREESKDKWLKLGGVHYIESGSDYPTIRKTVSRLQNSIKAF